MKILDCTLRDGGYYTNWDFPKEMVNTYFEAFNNLPVEYLEIGYRSNPMKNYLGEYFYCPVYVLEKIKQQSNKKLVIILDEKDVRLEDMDTLLNPCIGLIDMVRIALDPKQFSRALTLAAAIKSKGFEVGFNVMYMSKWGEQSGFISQLKDVNGIADYFYMVDSYGGVYPEDIRNTYNLVRSQTDVKIGFHGHNNLELALINSLTAIECGAEIIDATITGMGRGAGNLKTELLLVALASKGLIPELDFDALGRVVDPFAKMQADYGWGTNLPYMVSGANSLPQKDIMEWLTKRFYSFNSIIRSLHNMKLGQKDNIKLPTFSPEKKFSKAIIIGGGPSAIEHNEALKMLLKQEKDVCLIHSSSRNALPFTGLDVEQYYCLVGNEGHRLEKVFDTKKEFQGTCILPPYPRKMGTYIPSAVEAKTFELENISFTKLTQDSPTALAIQTAINLGISQLLFVGYDGYSGNNIGEKEQDLFMENELLFADARQAGLSLYSLNTTKYKELGSKSVYSLF